MTDSLVLVANAGDSSISTFRFADGSLERIAVTEGVAGCSNFAVDTARDLVYAAVDADEANPSPGIVTLAFDRSSGVLTPRTRRALPGRITYVALAYGGSVLLAVSYGGGFGVSLTITDGVVSEPVSRIEHRNLHSVLPSGDDAFAYFVSLGDDLVAQCALAADATLTPLGPPTVAAPEGSGPRHLAFSAAQDAVYVVTEFSGEVLHYARDTTSGQLQLRDAASAFDPTAGLKHSRFGADPAAEHLIWGADVHLGDGVLWASERTASTLAPLAVAGDGSVADATRFYPTEPQPRGFDVHESWLIAAGERSETISLYAIDGDRLELRQQIETGRGANWVRFI